MPGRFAESAEFFESLVDRSSSEPASLGEALANQGLQQSNLGNFAASDRLLARAEAASPKSDGVLQRLIRNYRALNQLNQGRAAEAITALSIAVPPVAEVEDADRIREGLITPPLSLAINRESATGQQVAEVGAGLTAAERSAILDGQAIELAGMALRQQKRLGEAEAKLAEARGAILAVREGKVQSARWLLSEIEIERALVAEARGDRSGASATFDTAIAALTDSFPDSPALLAAKARKAGFLLRSGDSTGGRALFGEVVAEGSACGRQLDCPAQPAGPLFRTPRQRRIERGGRGDVPRVATTAAARRRPDPGDVRAAIFGRQRRGQRTVPPGGRADARDRAPGGEIKRLEALAERTPAQEEAIAAGKSSLRRSRRTRCGCRRSSPTIRATRC